MKKLNFAILCAGYIAETMARTVSGMDDVVPYAIASRGLDRAQNLADKYGFCKAYGSYEELVEDENVDLVYVSSPHSLHYEHAKLCLEHGKHVLCEKPFTVNSQQAEILFLLAQRQNLFIMEAVWTRFQPFAAKLRDILESDLIGNPIMMTASIGNDLRHINRLVSPELAGGALLDLGIYAITIASMVFGKDVEKIESVAVKTERGVDAQNNITLVYKNGSMAVLNSSFLCRLSNQAVIYGSKGRVEIGTFWHPERIDVIFNDGSEPQSFDVPFDISGYEYEVRAAVAAIENGQTGCKEIPHEETLRIMGLMDQLRAEWGIRYPFE